MISKSTTLSAIFNYQNIKNDNLNLTNTNFLDNSGNILSTNIRTHKENFDNELFEFVLEFEHNFKKQGQTLTSRVEIDNDFDDFQNDIKNSDGEATITMNADQDVNIAGDLTVTGNTITFGNGEGIMNSTDNNVQINTSTDSNGSLTILAAGGSSQIIIKYKDIL